MLRWFLAWLHALLVQTKDIQLISSESIDEGLVSTAALAPAVVLIEMGPGVDIGTLVAVRRLQSSRVVLWILAISIEMAHALREAGGSGIVRKDALLN
jgi:hypothetical protein